MCEVVVEIIRLYTIAMNDMTLTSKSALTKRSALTSTSVNLYLFSPAGVKPAAASTAQAKVNLEKIGFTVRQDSDLESAEQRFAGTDAQRIAAFQRAANHAKQGKADFVMASRGGYGITRLLESLDFSVLADSSVQWLGHSDMTAFQIALFAHTRAASWQGPMAWGHFGADADCVPNLFTAQSLHDALILKKQTVSFVPPATECAAFAGLATRGVVWGGNLAMICSLLGTPHFPKAAQIRGGLLYLEDTNEPPYRIERMLLQLHQAGVLANQSAIILGDFGNVNLQNKQHLDNGYDFAAVVAHLRSVCKTPILTGLPFGHCAATLTLPMGRKAWLGIDDAGATLDWS